MLAAIGTAAQHHVILRDFNLAVRQTGTIGPGPSSRKLPEVGNDPTLRRQPVWSCYKRLDDTPNKRSSWPGPSNYDTLGSLDSVSGTHEASPAFTAGRKLGHLASGVDVVKIPVRPTPGPTYVEEDGRGPLWRPGPAVCTGALMREERFWDD
eukprot:SAG31_NODE_312_length_17856_cov_14.557827_9_plen_152_part_00